MQLGWASAGAFRSSLEKCSETLSKGTLEKLTKMAVKDAPYVRMVTSIFSLETYRPYSAICTVDTHFTYSRIKHSLSLIYMYS